MWEKHDQGNKNMFCFVFLWTTMGGKAGGEGGEAQGREGGEERRDGREDGEKERPGCWCELDEGRKEEERENIDLRQEKRRECDTEGPQTARTRIRSVEGGIRPRRTVRAARRISAVFLPVRPPVREEEDTPKERGKMLWAATSRDVEEGRTGRGGRCVEDGCSGRRYCENAVAVGCILTSRGCA